MVDLLVEFAPWRVHIYILPCCSTAAVTVLNSAGDGAQFARSRCSISGGILNKTATRRRISGEPDCIIHKIQEGLASKLIAYIKETEDLRSKIKKPYIFVYSISNYREGTHRQPRILSAQRFKNEMDKAVSIERRFKAMKAFYDAGIRTTCFISPIFPEITDVPAIIKKAKNQCNLIWLENLNLRGDYKFVILKYISEKYPALKSLYQDIYMKGDRSYWAELDKKMKDFCQKENLLYVRNDDSIKRPFHESPIVVNYFFHEEIIPSAKNKKAAE